MLNRILDTAAITPEDHLLEIGAGIGVLTRELTKRAKHVTTIELDRRMIELLKKFTENPENLTIIQGNALQTDFPDDDYKIVANIPYHITSPLLRHAFLESKRSPKTMTLLIQREVAEKICDTEDYGMLTILVALFGKPELIKVVKPGAFLPPPKVDSAILHIECFDEPKADAKTIEEVFRLTKAGFSKKRKMLRNSIGELEGGMALMESMGIDPTRRPQNLNIEEWIRLAESSIIS